MIRKAFIIQAQPAKAEEYVRRHNPIWEDLQLALKQHGISNYSIFLHPATRFLFCYMEIKNEEMLAEIAREPVVQRWWKYMTEVLVCENENNTKGWEELLREVFHLD